MKHTAHRVVKDLPISDMKLSQLRQVTKEDQDMQILSKCIRGLASKQAKCASAIKALLECAT